MKLKRTKPELLAIKMITHIANMAADNNEPIVLHENVHAAFELMFLSFDMEMPKSIVKSEHVPCITNDDVIEGRVSLDFTSSGFEALRKLGWYHPEEDPFKDMNIRYCYNCGKFHDPGSTSGCGWKEYSTL